MTCGCPDLKPSRPKKSLLLSLVYPLPLPSHSTPLNPLPAALTPTPPSLPTSLPHRTLHPKKKRESYQPQHHSTIAPTPKQGSNRPILDKKKPAFTKPTPTSEIYLSRKKKTDLYSLGIITTHHRNTNSTGIYCTPASKNPKKLII